MPQQLGFRLGQRAGGGLRDWNEAGVRQRRHQVLLAELRAADLLDRSRAVSTARMCGR